MRKYFVAVVRVRTETPDFPGLNNYQTEKTHHVAGNIGVKRHSLR